MRIKQEKTIITEVIYCDVCNEEIIESKNKITLKFSNKVFNYSDVCNECAVKIKTYIDKLNPINWVT